VEAAARREAPPAVRLLAAERWLLALVVQGAEGTDEALAELGEADIDGLPSAPLLRAVKAVWRRGEKVTLPALAADVDDDARRLLSEIAVVGVPADALSARECVREIQRLPLRARMAEIQKSLSQARGEALETLLAEKTRLVRRMASL
jgi:hypothetical protein